MTPALVLPGMLCFPIHSKLVHSLCDVTLRHLLTYYCSYIHVVLDVVPCWTWDLEFSRARHREARGKLFCMVVPKPLSQNDSCCRVQLSVSTAPNVDARRAFYYPFLSRQISIYFLSILLIHIGQNLVKQPYLVTWETECRLHSTQPGVQQKIMDLFLQRKDWVDIGISVIHIPCGLFPIQ